MPPHTNKKIPTKEPTSTASFVTWKDGDPESLKAAQAAVGQAYASTQPIMRNVRHGMDRSDYEMFRPNESTPKGRPEILAACIGAYDRVSPIKNIIDMMSDFTTEGIRPVHPNSQVNKFFQGWWKQVRGNDRSQHFANNFYLMGVAIAKRTIAKLSAKVIDDLQKSSASISSFVGDDSLDTSVNVYDTVPLPRDKVTKNVIPWSYTFLNPQVVQMVSGELGMFAGKPKYGFEIPSNLIAKIKAPKTAEEVELVNSLPSYITNTVLNKGRFVVFDESRIVVTHYKKHDWQQWANPILYSIMDDIILLQKMKLTDLAALDGAISHIRIWKLGSLEYKIMPTQAAFDKLNDVLLNAGNGQSFDLIWGPDLTLEETTSDIHKYLGQEKYIPVYSSLYSGLGVPPSLVGGSGGEAGFTNNFLSLKTLIERLNYGRQALTEFWENEFSMVQQAMGFRFPAQLEFKNAILTDEAAFHSMLIDLLDRDVISVDRVREHLGYIPEIEDSLVKYEWKARSAGKMPQKAGPFHDSDHEYAYKKIFATSGTVTPSQLGIDLPKPKAGEKSLVDLNNAVKTPPISSPAQKKGQQGEGRPKNSKDTVPRKTKRVVPRTSGGVADQSEFMDLFLWAKEAQQSISDIVNPIYTKMCNKTNMRQLTTAETEDVEHLKFVLLCNTSPHEQINDQSVAGKLQNPLPSHGEADNFWRALVGTYIEKRHEAPSVEDIKQIQSYVYALYNFQSNDSE